MRLLSPFSCLTKIWIDSSGGGDGDDAADRHREGDGDGEDEGEVGRDGLGDEERMMGKCERER